MNFKESEIFLFTNCYFDDILVASEGSFTDHKKIVYKILSTLDSCKLFQKENNWLGLNYQNQESLR